jgi:hypothetical protein
MHLACEENIFHMSGLSDTSNGLNNTFFSEDQEEQYHIGDGADSWEQPYNVFEANSRKRDNEDHLDLHNNGISKRAKSNGGDFGGTQAGTSYRSNSSSGMDNTLLVSTVLVRLRPPCVNRSLTSRLADLAPLHARSAIS